MSGTPSPEFRAVRWPDPRTDFSSTLYIETMLISPSENNATPEASRVGTDPDDLVRVTALDGKDILVNFKTIFGDPSHTLTWRELLAISTIATGLRNAAAPASIEVAKKN